jgi:hypothetical protein
MVHRKYDWHNLPCSFACMPRNAHIPLLSILPYVSLIGPLRGSDPAPHFAPSVLSARSSQFFI